MEYYIAIDIGTTYIKSGLVNSLSFEMSEIRKKSAPQNLYSEGVYSEVKAEEYLEIVKAIIEEYREDYPCVGVLFSCQLHSFLLCDDDKSPLTNLITWQDTRATIVQSNRKTILDELREEFGERFHHITGTDIKPGLPLCGLYSLKKQGSLFSSTTFCTLDSFIMWNLVGKNIVHETIAASTGIFDISKRVWSNEILGALEINTVNLPIATAEWTYIGTYQGMEVFPMIGDQQATILGILEQSKGEFVISMGTAGLASRIVREPLFGDYETRPFLFGQYLLTVRRQVGGRNFDVLFRFIRNMGEEVFGCTMSTETIIDRLNQMIPRIATSPLNMEMKFFEGQLGFEHGRIDDIRYDNFDVCNLFLAACESTAKSYHRALEVLQYDSDSDLILSGRIVNTLVMLKKAFIKEFDSKIYFSEDGEDTLEGLALLRRSI